MTQGSKIIAVNGQWYTTVSYYRGLFLVLVMEHALQMTEISYHRQTHNNLTG